MNMHPCTWASMKGRELKLSCPERVTLWQLAERAATKGFCWPSVAQLRDDTGLARQTILTVVRRLATLGLIRIEKDGQRLVYHLLHLVQDKTDRSKSEPVHDEANRSKSEPATGLKVNSNRSKNRPRTGLNLNPNLKENQKENLKGSATRRAPSSPHPDGRSSVALSPEPNTAPTNGATEGSPPDRPDPFADAGESKAFASGVLGRTVHLAVSPPEVVTEDDRPQTEDDRQRMAAQMAAVTAELEREFRERTDRLRYGDRQPFTPEEQADICAGIQRVKPYFLPPELLRAHRAALAARFPDA